MVVAGKWLPLAAAAGMVLAAAGHTARAESPGKETVEQLTAAMAKRQLEVIAAADPSSPNRYVAAMLIPGAQLLVVSAEYPNPPELQALMVHRQYRDVYSALHQPSTQASRLFFLDTGPDGVEVSRDHVDVLYEKGVTQVLFDGDWKKSKLSQPDYQQKTREAGEEYLRLVKLLHGSMGTIAAAR